MLVPFGPMTKRCSFLGMLMEMVLDVRFCAARRCQHEQPMAAMSGLVQLKRFRRSPTRPRARATCLLSVDLLHKRKQAIDVGLVALHHDLVGLVEENLDASTLLELLDLLVVHQERVEAPVHVHHLALRVFLWRSAPTGKSS